MTKPFISSMFSTKTVPARPALARIDSGRRMRELSEPELIQWAEQTAVSSTMDKLSGYGAVVFWILVAGLITARVFLFDASSLRPSASSTSPSQSALSLPHIKL